MPMPPKKRKVRIVKKKRPVKRKTRSVKRKS